MVTLLYNLHNRSSLQANVLNQPQVGNSLKKSKRSNEQKVNKQLTGVIVVATATTATSTTTREEVGS